MSRRQFALPQRSGDGPPDDTGCTILHVDMDAFYASASLLARPDLVGTPVIIGAARGRGVVLSATYEARRFGVTSAMPMSRAQRLCPQATVLPPDHELYSRMSSAVMEIFRSVTPVLEPLSLDEAFLDVSGAIRRLGPPATIGQLIRDTVHDEQRVTCSVGVAPSKFVAKLASGLAKPDGMVIVPVDEVVPFVQQLPVGALWGVGERTEEALLRLGLRTVADIAHTPLTTLTRALGDVGGRHLHDLSWGRDPRGVEQEQRERSIGSDETFAHDLDDPALIHRHLLALSERTASRVRKAGLAGRTISIKVRFADFTTITRSRTLREPTDVSREIYETAVGLYDALGLQRARIRLVGVRMDKLLPVEQAPIQARLDEPDHGWRDADRAIDRASARFGSGAVRPASLIPREQSSSRPPGDLS
ncbi:MAG TPA: DNA polymerase IV [Phycicoccus elongatus]|jgi:DNA polymerase-4|uniref:DNA polymerase IV n=1 Tax=Phycicoccus elongatus Lp2 TaxID=1193181 RepID=N0E3I3_9MICO|nr:MULTISPECIES: DNA polymerase IV [Phycicoccus]MCA0322557.1 DNA polymerase IV [Actinomycetota bacterium]MCB1239928.1 DNA polymerase IV [Tetrasphaera sp.]MCB9405699.1 DNA polymerase IV [Tetrasphaera sp.]MCO5303061.1 DNA polymerase IV [Phycicoccus sp.]CCH71528.1 DNA polymerase IV [Phycicoccus elongatus Lp2]